MNSFLDIPTEGNGCKNKATSTLKQNAHETGRRQLHLNAILTHFQRAAFCPNVVCNMSHILFFCEAFGARLSLFHSLVFFAQSPNNSQQHFEI